MVPEQTRQVSQARAAADAGRTAALGAQCALAARASALAAAASARPVGSVPDGRRRRRAPVAAAAPLATRTRVRDADADADADAARHAAHVRRRRRGPAAGPVRAQSCGQQQLLPQQQRVRNAAATDAAAGTLRTAARRGIHVSGRGPQSRALSRDRVCSQAAGRERSRSSNCRLRDRTRTPLAVAE